MNSNRLHQLSFTARWLRALAVTVAFLSIAARPAHAQWSVTPYFWATSIDANVSVAGRPVVDQRIPFSDLADDLDFAVLLRADAQFGAFGGSVDLFHVDMSSTGNAVTLPGGVPATLDTDIGMTLVDAVGTWHPGARREGLALVAGARMIAQDAKVDLLAQGAPAASSSETSDVLVDGIVGAQYLAPIGRHWSVDTRGDVGTGGTKLTWSAGAYVGYGFGSSQRFTLSAGYRYLSIEFKDDASVQASMAMSGGLLGLRIAL